ncbi:putative ribonuclease H-like domain-containing protein [Tanacetum coccineum]
MALMAFLDSEVYNDKSCSKTCLKNYETLKKQCDDLIVKLNETEFKAATYKRGLATVEDQLVTFRKNEVLFSEEIAVLKREVGCKDYEIGMLKIEYEKVKQEKEGIDFKIAKFDNASKSLDKLLESQITDNSYGPHDSKLESTIDYNKESDNSKENTDDSMEKEQVSDSEYSFVESSPNVVKETIFQTAKKGYFNQKINTVRPRVVNTARSYTTPVNTVRANGVNVVKPSACNPQMNNKGIVDSGCSRYMTGNITYLSNFKEFDGGHVTFGGGAYGGRISGKATKDETSEILKNFIKEIENLVDKKVKIIRCDNGTKFKNKVMDDFCREKGIRREYSIARTPQQNGVAERRNRTLIKAAKTMLADSKLPTTFWAEAVSTACYVQNRVLIVKPHNKTSYELFRGFKPALGFMRPFGCHVTILNTLDSLGKFDGKVMKNKPMIEGNGPKWLFDIDSLTQSMNYVPVAAGIISNESADASYFDSSSKDVGNDEPKSVADDPKHVEDGPSNEDDDKDKFEDDSSPKEVNADEQQVNITSPGVNTDEDEPDVELGNIPNSYAVPATPNTRIHQHHPLTNVIEEPKRVSKALSDPSWVEAMQEELLQFKLQKTDERGIIIRNKARLVAQGYTQEEGIDYDDVFSLVARIEAIRLFLAYASFMGFIVYQMDVKSAFLYGTIEEEVYVCQPPGFEDPNYPDKFYKVVKALYGLHQAPRAWYETLAKYLLDNGFHKGRIDQTLFVKKQKGDILLVQAYVDDIIFGSTNKELCTGFEKLMKDKFQMTEILRKFNYTNVKTTFTPVDLERPLVKDGDADDVDVHLYRSIIGSLMYLTASRPDIMFAVCACARFQVTPKTSHLLAVKRIFRYLKGKPTLGLWYSRNSPFELVAYTDSDYAGATQDRKSTTGGCQFLGNRLISCQCKMQTVVATSITEAEYVAATSYCGQVLWIQNQLLDYGYNFMNTMIHIDYKSTICIIENPVQHSKTKHIEIRHPFIRDYNAKRLIQMVKIDTEHNVADLLTKGFDAGRFQYLVSSIGMLNP